MRKLVIASGKGGTGKTTVACSFAALASSVTIADCDVDASNLNVLLKGAPVKDSPFMAGYMGEVLTDRCTGCGLCQEKCRFSAVSMSDGTAAIDPLYCEGCGLCAFVCPEQAIRMREKQSGVVYEARTRFGTLVYAELLPGEGNSGKLVTEVRMLAEQRAADEKTDLLLVDASPGIGCPVIASLTGADLALVVTEPTLSGIHDLKRVLELTRHFSIATCVCVNKADLDEGKTRETERLCREGGVEYLGSIPYDVAIYKAQCDGLSAVEIATSPVRSAIEKIWQAISSVLA